MELTRRIKEALSGGGTSPDERFLLSILNTFLCFNVASCLLCLICITLGCSTIEGLFNLALILSALIVYLAFLSPRVPKRFVIVPLICILLYNLLSAPAYFLSGISWKWTDFLLTAIQFAAGALTLGLIRLRCGAWLLRAKDLGDKVFTRGYLLRFLGASALFTFSLAVMVFGAVMLGVGHYSSGFIRLTPFSLQLGRKTMEKEGKQVILQGMSHVGSKYFYDKLKDNFPLGSSIILSEGIRDSKNLIKVKSRYEGMASAMGVTVQPAKLSETIATRNADLDVSEFSPETIELLNLAMGFHAALGSKVSAKDRILFLLEYDSKFSKQFYGDQQKLIRILEDDIVRKRNSHLLSEIMVSLDQYDVIIVPWGVWHMPGIERLLEESGFKYKDQGYYSLF